MQKEELLETLSSCRKGIETVSDQMKTDTLATLNMLEKHVNTTVIEGKTEFTDVLFIQIIPNDISRAQQLSSVLASKNISIHTNSEFGISHVMETTKSYLHVLLVLDESNID